jgi:hypothetical protein
MGSVRVTLGRQVSDMARLRPQHYLDVASDHQELSALREKKDWVPPVEKLCTGRTGLAPLAAFLGDSFEGLHLLVDLVEGPGWDGGQLHACSDA